jgi:hypothetical protein
MAFNYSPKIVTDGLVLYLDAANPNSYVSGSTTWSDLSRGGNNGTLVNGPTFNSANGGSIVFDGVDDFISESTLTNLLMGNTTFTLTIWIYPTNLTSAYMTLLDTLNRQLSLWMGTNGNGQFYGLGGTTTSYSTNFNWENNKWQMITIIANPTNGQIVKNNYQVSETISKGGSFTQQLTFGNNPSGGGINMKGRYGIIQFYNRALTSQEVLQNFNATKTRFGL